MGKCAIIRCRTVHKKSHKRTNMKNKILFKVPKDDHVFNKWKQAVPSPGVRLARSSFICEDHFQEADIIRESSTLCEDGSTCKIPVEPAHLKKGAIPCFFYK